MQKKKILVIEDSDAMLEFERKMLEDRFDFPVLTAQSYQEAQEILLKDGESIFVALADLILPDAQNGEIVDLLTEAKLPTIVFTGQYNDELREFILKKPIVDYILKNNLNNFQYALRLVSVIDANQYIKALVVDDSRFARMKVELSLKRLHIDVLHASNKEEALQVLEKNSDISLIVTDYHMEKESNGIMLTSEIRRCYGCEQMIIIGYSSDSSNNLPIEFIKNGANDFMPYNYSEEEFTLRVMSNLELMAQLRNAHNMAIRDYMTGLYNRRYLFEASTALYHRVKRDELQLGVAIIDIDHFKMVNDTYGHDVGDKVIQHISNMLLNNIRKSDVLARIGGEEFCLLFENANDSFMNNILEKLRYMAEQTPLTIEHNDKKTDITVTLSIGFTTHRFERLDEAMKKADDLLYAAKQSGRNNVCCDL